MHLFTIISCATGYVNTQKIFRVPTGFGAKTETKTSKHPSIKDFIFCASHFLPIWPKPKPDYRSEPTTAAFCSLNN
jgi:hypothetical protein